MALLEISVSPRGGQGVGISQYVARALRVLKDSGLAHQTHAMGTVIEGDIDALFEIAQRMHAACFDPAGEEILRVVTSIKIDDRRDKQATMQSKVDALAARLNES
ncbi:MAG: MTH1187 family thiamine-binding protein [Deltaproteobacteria bacterium]|nr:MTH1187 family thiamine-binding protein [Deltaproteobacteria bacterium]